MFASTVFSARARSQRVVVVVAATLLLGLSTRQAGAQGLSAISVTMTYTGSLGPVSRQRPLCLCVYNDPALHDEFGCYIAYENRVSIQVSAFGTKDYFLIAFLDIDGNELADSNEPYEIYRDRAESPADAVTASANVTSVEITFGDENLPPTATASPTPTPTATPTPTLVASATATHTPTMNPCTGDCDGSGSVTVDEILIMVNIALGNLAVDGCRAGDRDASHAIEVDEILAAVTNAEMGCPRAS